MILVLFSANDAGGANAIAPVVEKLRARGDRVHGILGGPAKAVFAPRGVPFVSGDELEGECLSDLVSRHAANLFLAGTSGGETIEKRILSRLSGCVPSISVLDFWSNYRQRFTQPGGAHCVPDRICVMDERAKVEAIAAGLPKERIFVTGNPHFEEFATQVNRASEDHNVILFLSQPLSEATAQSAFTRYGFEELEVLDSVIRVLERSFPAFVLRLRRHPSEAPGKFDGYRSSRVCETEGKTLAQDIANAGLVIGMFSPSLIQAAVAGKVALSYQPGLRVTDPLPSNAVGITRRISTEDELEDALRAYAAHSLIAPAVDPALLWRRGAAERVVRVIDDLIGGPRSRALTPGSISH